MLGFRIDFFSRLDSFVRTTISYPGACQYTCENGNRFMGRLTVHVSPPDLLPQACVARIAFGYTLNQPDHITTTLYKTQIQQTYCPT
jgi:hypothetical protein